MVTRSSQLFAITRELQRITQKIFEEARGLGSLENRNVQASYAGMLIGAVISLFRYWGMTDENIQQVVRVTLSKD